MDLPCIFTLLLPVFSYCLHIHIKHPSVTSTQQRDVWDDDATEDDDDDADVDDGRRCRRDDGTRAR